MRQECGCERSGPGPFHGAKVGKTVRTCAWSRKVKAGVQELVPVVCVLPADCPAYGVQFQLAML